jgi:hypothetical protein
MSNVAEDMDDTVPSKAEIVEEIMRDCLFRDTELDGSGEPPSNAVLVEGINAKFGLHPERLESHRLAIKEILLEMPDAFHMVREETPDGGGGMSFLNLCVDKKGEQWAEHPTMQNLVCLAAGLNMARTPLPREMWNALPGGMPYIVFDVEGKLP